VKFTATIEYLLGQRAAIVELHDADGVFAGGSRIDLRPLAFETTGLLRGRLYEVGYSHASRCAAVKGGHLDRFTVAS
jgi:hypothetical protein